MELVDIFKICTIHIKHVDLIPQWIQIKNREIFIDNLQNIWKIKWELLSSSLIKEDIKRETDKHFKLNTYKN